MNRELLRVGSSDAADRQESSVIKRGIHKRDTDDTKKITTTNKQKKLGFGGERVGELK